MRRARILLGEDHSDVAVQLCALLETKFRVIAVVNDGDALISAEESTKPDVIVTDIAMPKLDGILAATRILQKNPRARIVFITIHNHPALIQKSRAIGALGYVLKVAAGEDLIPAVQAALKGTHYPPSNGTN